LLRCLFLRHERGLERLAVASSPIRIETFGRTVEGGDVLAVIANKVGAPIIACRSCEAPTRRLL
jgi:hypothetical protein